MRHTGRCNGVIKPPWREGYIQIYNTYDHYLRTAELEEPNGSSSQAPLKEALWGIELPTFGCTARDLTAIQQFFYYMSVMMPSWSFVVFTLQI